MSEKQFRKFLRSLVAIFLAALAFIYLVGHIPVWLFILLLLLFA
jgi:hypothetical protein